MACLRVFVEQDREVVRPTLQRWGPLSPSQWSFSTRSSCCVAQQVCDTPSSGVRCRLTD